MTQKHTAADTDLQRALADLKAMTDERDKAKTAAQTSVQDQQRIQALESALTTKRTAAAALSGKIALLIAEAGALAQ